MSAGLLPVRFLVSATIRSDPANPIAKRAKRFHLRAHELRASIGGRDQDQRPDRWPYKMLAGPLCNARGVVLHHADQAVLWAAFPV